jgi:cell division septal protein FtsQ
LLVFAGAYGIWVLLHSSLLQVKHLEVSGVRRVDPGEVAARAKIGTHANVWLLDTHAIEQRVETIPYVLTARVHRTLPANVSIEVTERKPDGCVRGTDGLALTVDGAGRVLERGCAAGSVAYLPHAVSAAAPGRFLNDPELAQLQRDAHALANSGERLKDFRHDQYGQLEASLADGIRIRFGDEAELDRKQRLIGPILASLGARIGGVTTIDLRAPATPVVERK